MTSDRLVGTLLDDRYRVEARIASGGMSTVYRGLDTRLDRPVALNHAHCARFCVLGGASCSA